MARKPNYNFERLERERAKAAKKAARQEAKRDKAEKRNQGDLQPDENEPSRAVSNFDEEVWGSVARQVVARGCLLKFQQNEELRTAMEKTGETALVECAPRDTRWGIGLARDNPRALQPGKWRGTNWLGQSLVRARLAMETREDLPLPHLPS